ncbi:uncharacterized protein TrAFT101_007348 [Trichoderma asperellum]|uniref:uncharacterized protein n=1 Tax=Trichoderma asperellum TaxID=101201 RepID=UPI0033196756|nr:hypothetical protein TrAFT101_007348 [Trichoderma asperellum]
MQLAEARCIKRTGLSETARPNHGPALACCRTSSVAGLCVGGAQVRSYCATARNGFDRAQS